MPCARRCPTPPIGWRGPVPVSATSAISAPGAALGVQSPASAVRWAAALGGPDDVVAWKLCGFPRPELAGRWRKMGLGPGMARRWRQAVWSPNRAEAWLQAGIRDPAGIAGWRLLGVLSPEQREPWTAAGVIFGNEVEIWATLGVRSPDDVRRWIRAGALGAADAAAWGRVGVTLGDLGRIGDWLRTGAEDGRDAAAWAEAGVGPSGLAEWKAGGVSGGRELVALRVLGVEAPSEVQSWRSAGVRGAAMAEQWVKAGVRSLEDLRRWHDAGVTSGAAAVDWVSPSFATGPSEVAAWRAAGFTEPANARTCGKIPDRVAEIRRRAIQLLGTNALGGAPDEIRSAVPAASPFAARTERWHYTLGRRCRPEVATELLEIDVDADADERSRRVRWLRPIESPINSPADSPAAAAPITERPHPLPERRLRG